MKFILKGKQLLNKKLEELEIISNNLDLVEQQIPGRLKDPLKVLRNNQIDLESNDRYENYFKSYPNHHISHYLLDKLRTILESGQLPRHNQISTIKQFFVPPFNKELETKALFLKEVVDEYDEGYSKIEEPLVCMAVIHFHHKRGTEVQYRYPGSKLVESLDNLIVHHAMPDSSHNKMEDYNFFNFEAEVNGKVRMLFGVSYFKQIKVTEEMKQQNSEITRSYLQKALAVLSYLPLFGYLKLRLSSTIKLFFQDYNNHGLIDSAYKEINKSLSQSWPKLEMSQLYIGSDLRTIIGLFGAHEFYEIWKAILYQKRVVIFAHSSSSASSFIISLLTLFPGLSTFGVFSQPISRYMQGLREYGLPLRTFSSDNFMAMSFHIQDFHLLAKFQKSSNGSFLIGTTNRLLKEANDYGIEMLINLENCTVEKNKPRVPWQPLSKSEKQFIGQLEQHLKAEKSHLGYEGSEDSIRDKFHNFLKYQLIGIMKAAQSLRKWVDDCEEYQKKSEKKERKSKSPKARSQYLDLEEEEGEARKGKSRKQSEEFPPLIPSEVTQLPFPGLLLTHSFCYFLQFHNEQIPAIMEGTISPSLLIENYEYCYVTTEKEFIAYNWLENKLSFGKGRHGSFEGKEIKFITEAVPEEQPKIKFLYIGHVDNYKFSKNGFYLDQNQLFEGEFENGAREGYGKLTNQFQKYIGHFKNNLFEGQGQLIEGAEIYVGEFKEGMKHGLGRAQGCFNYDGEWVTNKAEGNGVLKLGEVEYIGRFRKGEIDESNEMTIKYEDGSMYKGLVSNLKPNGKGCLISADGVKAGIFKDGVLLEEGDAEETPPSQDGAVIVQKVQM